MSLSGNFIILAWCALFLPYTIPLRVRIVVYLKAEPSVVLSAFEEFIN
jgi:hypothetical protein